MADKTDAWMPLWIGAYLADTQHLARDEHGGYLLLIMAYWRAGGPLLDDDKRLAAITKCSPKEWKELRPVLAEFFDVAGGVWRHRRIDIELASAASNKAQRSAAGKASAAKRAQQRAGQTGNVIPTSVATGVQRKSNPTPTPTPTPFSVAEGSGTHTENYSEQGASACLTAGAVCKRIIQLGISPTTCNPGHPDLSALLAAGACMAEFEGAAKVCMEKGKGFQYLLGIVKGQREQAAKLVLHQGAMPGETDKEQAREAARARLFGGEEHAAA